jgi:hypothetical protein
MMKWVVAVTIILLAGVLTATVRAQPPAQEATPTPQASYITATTLSSGNAFVIERRISYGDLFVGLSALIAAVVVALGGLPDLWNRIRQ